MQAFYYKDTCGNEAVVLVNGYDAEFVKRQMIGHFRNCGWRETDKAEVTPIEQDSFVISAGASAYLTGAHDLFRELKP